LPFVAMRFGKAKLGGGLEAIVGGEEGKIKFPKT
jgi:hypothetical protein